MAQLESLPIGAVRENPDNPRTITEAKFRKLVASIRAFPEMLTLRPLVVNAENVVLGGNMRLRACREAGLTHVPVVRAATLTPEQQREFIVKDNASFGEWDWDTLANDWSDLPLSDWGLDVPAMPAFEELPPDQVPRLDKVGEKSCPHCGGLL